MSGPLDGIRPVKKDLEAVRWACSVRRAERVGAFCLVAFLALPILVFVAMGVHDGRRKAAFDKAFVGQEVEAATGRRAWVAEPVDMRGEAVVVVDKDLRRQKLSAGLFRFVDPETQKAWEEFRGR